MKNFQQKLKEITIDKQEDIPWIVRFLENPNSLFALPGKISLYNHDFLHALLDRKTSLQDEAFLVGFCMGNDPKTNFLHIWIFKLFSRYLYPQSYRFNDHDFWFFELGFKYGKIFKIQFNSIEFSDYTDFSLPALRQKLGIKHQHLNWIIKYEIAYLKCKELGIDL